MLYQLSYLAVGETFEYIVRLTRRATARQELGQMRQNRDA